MRNQLSDWQSPGFEASAEKRLGWAKEAIQDGERFVKSLTGYSDIPKALSILAGNTPDTPRGGKWPTINSNRLKRNTREIVETLANIRPFWGYTTDNKDFLAESNMLNKISRAVYMESFVDRSLRDALQFAAATGAGFISPGYVRKMYGKGTGTFQFEPLGRFDVLPVQLPSDKDYQEAYAVTLVRTFPVAKAHAMFPEFQDKLKPFARSKYAKGSDQRVSSFRRNMGQEDDYEKLYSEIFYTYILDLSVNLTDRPIPMGQAGTSWFYEVPCIGQTIRRWDADNRKFAERPAMDDDCRLYPQRRLMISCESALMYDGPGFDWHGMVPIVPFYMDDWVFEKSGLSIMRDGMEIQSAINQLERSIMRVANARVNPSKQYDASSPDKRLSSRQAESIDPFDPDVTVAVEGDASKSALGPLLPQWMLEVPGFVPAFIKELSANMDYQMGINDVASLAKLKVLGNSAEGLEKMMESQGPVVLGVSRGMERGMRDLGDMFKYLLLQYMTTTRTIQYVGEDGITPSVLDFDPASLVPSHMPGEMSKDTLGEPVYSGHTRTDRAKFFAENLRFYITPHSLHEIVQNQQKLVYLNLAQRGGMIDPETLANALSVPNWGTLEGSTIKEKLQSYEKEKVIFAAQMEKLKASLGGEPGMPQQPQPEGRPPSGKKMPHLKQKGDGRTTVAQS